jgi:hypothetical protein
MQAMTGRDAPKAPGKTDFTSGNQPDKAFEKNVKSYYILYQAWM